MPLPKGGGYFCPGFRPLASPEHLFVPCYHSQYHRSRGYKRGSVATPNLSLFV